MKTAGYMTRRWITGKYTNHTINPRPGSTSIKLSKTGGFLNRSASSPPGVYQPLNIASATACWVNLKAYRIRINPLIEDVKAYIRSNPWRLDWRQMKIDNIGWRLVHENQTRYVGQKTADWDLKLDPDKRHWDRRVTIKLPKALTQAGAYLLTAEMQNGNTARIIIWVSDTDNH